MKNLNISTHCSQFSFIHSKYSFYLFLFFILSLSHPNLTTPKCSTMQKIHYAKTVPKDSKFQTVPCWNFSHNANFSQTCNFYLNTTKQFFGHYRIVKTTQNSAETVHNLRIKVQFFLHFICTNCFDNAFFFFTQVQIFLYNARQVRPRHFFTQFLFFLSIITHSLQAYSIYGNQLCYKYGTKENGYSTKKF